MIPKEWDVKKLKDIAEIKYGKGISQNKGNIPVIGSGGTYSFVYKPLVSFPTIIIGRKGTAGKVWLSEIPCWPSDTTFYLIWKRKEISYYFIYLFLTLNPLSGEHAKTTLPSVQKADLENIEIPIPPFPEQRAIAQVLRTVQEAREKTEAVIEATKALKKAMMKHLFTYGPVPLEEVAKVPLKETEIGLVPEGWEVVHLAQLFNIKHGYSFKGEFFGSVGKYVVLTPGHFKEEGGFKDQKEKTKFYTIEPHYGYLLKRGDLLVAMTEQSPGLLGSSIIIPESNKYLHNQRLGLIHNIDTSRLDKEFLFFFFNLKIIRKSIFQTASGLKVKHTSPGKIRALHIALPSLQVQQQIVHLLQTIDQKLIAEESHRQALDALFKTLLRDLMTAKIRVKFSSSSGKELDIK
jgi:type I restriction enzyme S subunit